ncbi:hypothetical protein ACJ73_08528 [Blastomyces percursus]|uniref:CCHC-type domain-containing protein n=1 Tax=Blastomyces percursus TaxID=1658174 RepID=A0A1J9PW51_9EURO|nr:hypothetical protein ACJ73_08528 [Blastomyces percursus]
MDSLKERLGTPATFDASNLSLYPSWRLDMLAKLEVDGATIGSLTNQAWYVSGRLTGRAKQKFHPTHGWRLAILHSNARQRNIPFTTFLPDFDTKILEAGGQLWEDRMKISMLKKALSFELLKALVSVEEAATYEAFCIQLRKLDDRLTRLKSIQSGSGRRYNPATNAPATQKDPDAMEWVDSNVYAQRKVSATRPSYRVPGLSHEEVADRRRRGVCINCERTGHIAANCKFDHVPPSGKEKVRVNHATVGGELRLRRGRSRKGPEAGKRLAPAKIRRQEPVEAGRQQFEDKMMMDAILVPAIIDNMHNINAMVDSGLCHYAMIKSSVVRRLNLQRAPLPKPRPLAGFDGPRETSIHFMVRFGLDVGGHRRDNVYAYEVNNLDSDLMLGISWLAEQGILLDARNRTLIFPNRDRIHESDVHNPMELKQISANAYELLRKSSRRNRTKRTTRSR